ncbi:succinate dehydrogenase, hydrophobic membrane anchor protein [Limobrevibacterium gyesilva]|uniref:Succinate dehydrogenase hydrophobic membrane anchor subunit n=1 Tax=Limobrevibacterium gyesilva TaxID=2991712 RepID=A0AA41YNG9_9PROT|nr:succinate dehydrogenase, hydrophobic membrane anchor protein [Limobrevibacterium gyesilva]MCW3473560.1 succinate dehydrogenase, hydrophobic membrane anchor protein [Limobrevibacterium gyesilva]
MADKAASPVIMRSMLGQVRGLGSAKAGTAHWWAQRMTAVALVPLTLWFVCAVIRLAGLPRAAVVDWAASPLTATLLVALVLATFHHLQLGLQVVMEDYIHRDRPRMLWLLVMKAAAALLGLAALIAVLKLAFTG